MENNSYLEVYITDNKVGTLARTSNGLCAFEYTESWLRHGFALNPLQLPLEQKVFMPRYDPFNGLFGVFADSLPDGWGRLLVDRFLASKGLLPSGIDPLNRLAIVGASGMGALEYRPAHELTEKNVSLDYDRLALECKKLLQTNISDNLDELFQLGGSSGGARPKILTNFDGEDWIVKFPSSYDEKNIGEIEYRYAEAAQKCGIQMSECRLLPSKICSGYFATKRFDRYRSPSGNVLKKHMVSVSGLLETSHRYPNLDYNDLMKLTLLLTRNAVEAEKLFRLMCFNVFAHNRDDHSKNFSYIYDEDKNNWELAPAYDLTYSNSIGGEHATCINGNGIAPGLEDLLAVAQTGGLNKNKARRTALEIEAIVKADLSDLLKQHSVFS